MRLEFESYFMQMAELAAERSTCLRRKVGAVAVIDNNIISTGYNGAIKGQRHCTDVGCLRENVPTGERHELCRGAHAEQNVILQAVLHGSSLSGATMYCTSHPCSICAKMIITAGFKQVIYKDEYKDRLAEELLRGQVQVSKYTPPTVVTLKTEEPSGYLKSCSNCFNNTFEANSGPCRTCWNFTNWKITPGDTNFYYWPEHPDLLFPKKDKKPFRITYA